jgi:hypothetical protein
LNCDLTVIFNLSEERKLHQAASPEDKIPYYQLTITNSFSQMLEALPVLGWVLTKTGLVYIMALL